MKKWIIIFLFIGIVYGNLYFETNFYKVKHITIKSNKIQPKDYISILQISDVHDKKSLGKNEKMLKKIEGLNSDFIVITGDLIDGKTKDYKNIYTFVEKINKINPNIYFVPGNHEWRNGNIEHFLEGLKERKVIVLDNSNRVFRKGKNLINICGIDDPYTNHEDVKKAFDHIDEEVFTLLLSHSPDIVNKEKNLPTDLILSGHTHGGQVRVPFIGGIVAPGQGFLPEYDKGIYEVWDHTTLYIDSGLGNSVAPIRFLNRSQMTIINIEGK